MRRSKTPVVFFAVILSLFLMVPQSAFAYWVWSPEAGKFINAEGVTEGPAEEQFKYAMRYIDEGKPEKAIDELDNLVKRYPNARIAADALFQIAVLYEQKSDHYKAFKEYKKILESYPQSPRIDEVIARTYAIGNLFLSGQKARVMGFAVMPAFPKAVEVFKTISETAPFSAYGDRALFNLGIAYKKTRAYPKAIRAFQKLIDEYPSSELLSDAKFQLADTAFQMSIAKTDRDLSSLDAAEASAEAFIKEHPDTHMTAKAAELVKVIEDKNAEKNYKIGLYYERENYIDSALIYYEDVVKKYPITPWAEKARERIGQLKDPEKFMKIREDEIQNRLAILSEKELAVQSRIEMFKREADTGSQAVAEREVERLTQERDRLEKELEDLSKFKTKSIKTRLNVLKIKQAELKKKWKNLDAKKKYYKKRMTDDLVRAFERWEESLNAEEYALQRERAEVEQLAATWGVSTRSWFTFSMPFFGKEKIGSVMKYKEKQLVQLEDETSELGLKAEILKEDHIQVLEDIDRLNAELSELYLHQARYMNQADSLQDDLAEMQASLDKQRQTVDELAGKLKIEKDKTRGGSKEEAKSKIPFAGIITAGAKTLSLPVKAAKQSVSWVGSAMPKFAKTKDLPLEGLETRRGELKLEVADLKNEIQSTQDALDLERRELTDEETEKAETIEIGTTELTMKEKRALRKEIRQLHREIRSRYQEVEDRRKKKDALIEKLSAEVDEVKKSVSLFERSKNVLKPVTGAGWLVKAFIFGLPDKEQEAIKGAQHLEKGLSAEQVSRVSALKEEIEYEIIMIDTRHSEILEYEKQLDEKEAAAKAAGIQLQDLSVWRPDRILKDNFDRLARLIAPRTREEILLNRLETLSGQMDEALVELDAVEKAIQLKTAKEPEEPEAAPAAPPVSQPVETAEPEVVEEVPTEAPEKPVAPQVEETVPEISQEELEARYQEEKRKYESQLARFQEDFKEYLSEKGQDEILKEWEKREDVIDKEREKLIEKRNEIERELSFVYHKEAETIEEMRSLVEEKIVKVNEKLKVMRFKAGRQADQLREERVRLENLLKQLGSRLKLLRNEEMKLLQPLEIAHA